MHSDHRKLHAMREFLPSVAPQRLKLEEFGTNAEESPSPQEKRSPAASASAVKLSMVPLVALIFYEVSCGPFPRDMLHCCD